MKIRNDGIRGDVEIFLIYKDGNHRKLMSYKDNGTAEMTDIVEGKDIKPSIWFNIYDGKEVLAEFARAIDQLGVKTDKDAKTEGILEATREHLSDMRKLVFKGDQV